MLAVVQIVADAGSYSSRLPVALALGLANVVPSGARSQDAERRAWRPPRPARRVVERSLLVRLVLFVTCSSGSRCSRLARQVAARLDVSLGEADLVCARQRQ